MPYQSPTFPRGERPAETALRLLVAMLPLLLFIAIYSSMRFYPNYLFREVDVRGVYDMELALFGIQLGGGNVVTPNEFFAIYAGDFAYLLAGLFYLCWVPLPVVFALYLFATGRRAMCFRFMSAFLVVNLVGFIGYYVYPAAPPWYVQLHGFEPDFATPGYAAGLLRFDAVVGAPVYETFYSGNANVFAAIPSLHAAYCPVACFYAMKSHERVWTVVFAVVSAGIWWSAICTGHHYTIDVLLGIATAILGLTLFETLLMRTSPCRRVFDKCARWLQNEN